MTYVVAMTAKKCVLFARWNDDDAEHALFF